MLESIASALIVALLLEMRLSVHRLHRRLSHHERNRGLHVVKPAETDAFTRRSQAHA